MSQLQAGVSDTSMIHRRDCETHGIMLQHDETSLYVFYCFSTDPGAHFSQWQQLFLQEELQFRTDGCLASLPTIVSVIPSLCLNATMQDIKTCAVCMVGA